MENGMRIFKDYIDRKLYYRFKHFPKFIIKMPAPATQALASIADFRTTFADPDPPTTPQGSYDIVNGPLFMRQEIFENITIKSMLPSAAYPKVFTTSVLQRTVISSSKLRFVVGFFDSAVARTVTCTIYVERAINGQITVSIAPDVEDPHRWYFNPVYINVNVNQKNDLNNLTANFNLDTATSYTRPLAAFFKGPSIIFWTLQNGSTLENNEYHWKFDSDYQINSQLNLDCMQGAAVCMPQLNPVFGINSLVMGSDMFATSRGRLIPSFIENADARNVINFQNISTVKSFTFYFNSLNALSGRKLFLPSPTQTIEPPDIYVFFK
jgi:hypothetical protein